MPSQEGFLDFHKHVDNRLLFYTYDYEEKEDYYIPEEYHTWFEDSEIQRLLSGKINEYNKKLDDINFDQPSELIMFYVKDGFVFYNTTIREEIFELSDGDTVGYSLVEEVGDAIPEEKIMEIREKQKKALDQKTQEIKDNIFNDPEFKNATNANLRRSYASRYFKDHPEECELLRAAHIPPILFVEKIWKEFKSMGLHK
ncbi:hypothetical protein [Bacillus amyloliquefaciens]|uniref:hypothetical protein n=1 Tax=Bacillus amyloliquefaciens TaxID=1390 RepID=UPI000206EDBB|nr:hypothetical protein [Bacillus amyloliquefaciens]AEB63145.1 hypothetical protein LL3_01604 [Bacillus amyloliquefaciens LL3]